MTTGGAQHKRRCIALIGLRGSGKTTVGRQLADLLDGKCVDTDDLVVEQAGQSIAAIFAQEGEAGFRRREREAIKGLLATPPAVISVGGGAVLDERNVEALRRVATLVWLTAPPDVLWQRILSDRAGSESRPPLTDRIGRDEIEHLLAQRSPLYEQAADVAVDTTRRTPREVAEAIISPT